MVTSRRENLLFACFALIGAFIITRGLIAGPGYTDVFYHLNAATRLASGQGLTDPYIWSYIGVPETLPIPSHLYWMPMTSLTAAFGMWTLTAPGNYAAAQWPFALMFAATSCVGFWLGGYIGKMRRHAWVVGLLTLFSGFFTRFWGAIDTFAPYALFGSLCLVFIALTVAEADTKNNRFYWLRVLLAGICAGLAHLTRADGVLLLIVAWTAALWPWDLFGKNKQTKISRRLLIAFVITLGYFLAMLPWFIRNLNAIGTPMPLGGTQAIWFRGYDDIFSYPPDASPALLFADGLGTFLQSRWLALTNNLGTFIAVEGLIVMTPLMLIGLWVRRKSPFLRGFWLYALGLHLAMTFVFPFPGYRGGLLHSAAALIPWWGLLGILGLDDCVDWMAKRRRRWNAKTAKQIYTIGLVGVAIFLSVFIALPNRISAFPTPAIYEALKASLPADARVMINDPAQLYTYTGLGGVVLPNETPDVIPAIARIYDVRYLLVEGVSDDGTASIALPEPLWPLLSNPPDFLIPIPFDIPGVRLYEIRF